MKKHELTISDEANEFAKLIAAGVESWRQAGKIIAKRYQKDPTFIRQCAEASGLLEHTLKFFIRIGQGTLNPRLLLRDSLPGVKRAMALPIADQRRLESEPIDIADRNQIIHLTIFELDKTQAAQAIGPDGVRTVEQQKHWLANRIRSPSKAWYVAGERVVFTRKAVLSAREIEAILAELAAP